MIDRSRLEGLLADCGKAINANNGRCGCIEDALCRMTTLLVELLNEADEQEYSERMHRENPCPGMATKIEKKLFRDSPCGE